MEIDDRSLDIAVVGLGQGGGNLAAQFSQFGYRAIALNTALTDLSALADSASQNLLAPEQRIYIGLDGYDGAGGDLNYGRECIRENAAKIRQAVVDHCGDADLVLITAGLGGGTGSSASELVKTLEDLDLPLLVMATLPTDNESGMAKVNAMRGANALVQLTNTSWIFVDNSRLAEKHSDVPMARYFDTINNVIVEPLDSLNRVNATPELTPIRTLDGEDLRRLLLAGGVINYASVDLPQLDVDAVIESVRAALQSSSIMPAGYVLEQVTTIGLVVQAPEDILARTPFSFYERLNERVKDATNGAATYLGVYRNRSARSRASMQLICSSQQLPTGIFAMVNDARREGGVLRDKLHQTLSPLDVSELEEFDLFRTSVRTTPGTKTRRRRPAISDDAFDVPAGLQTSKRATADSTKQGPATSPSVAPPSAVRHAPSTEPERDNSALPEDVQGLFFKSEAK